MKMEQILLKDIDKPDLIDIAIYIKTGGYSSLEKALQMQPNDIIDEVKKVLAARELEYDIEIIREIRSASSDFSDQMTQALEQSFGPGMMVPYATEMAVFCELNSRIFVLGPGEPGRAHKPDEFMTMDEIMAGAEAIIKASSLI